MTPIDISPKDLETVKAILAAQVPECEVRAFGSRVQWTSKDSSDLDLVVMTEKPLEAVRLADLKEAFSESDLPFRVDVVDWAGTKEGFRKIIEKDCRIVQKKNRSTQMMDNWQNFEWGDIASLEYGKSLRDYCNDEGRYQVYGTNGPIGWHSEPLCKHPGVIIGRKGAYRGIHYSAQPFFVIDTAFYLEPKIEMDLRWAYYCLLTYDINGMDSGSAIPSTSREDFYKLPVKLPPLEQQRAIAHILGTLDDKIELNRRMNQTLEEIARAIFKSWFVDFDPVRKKAAGKKTGLPEDIDKLFPEGFERSELGEIPKGWRVGPLDDLLVLQRGFDLPKAVRFDRPYPLIADSGQDGTNDEAKVKGPGVVTGRSGKLGITTFVQEDFWPLNTTLLIKDYKISNPYHAYLLLQALGFERFNAGSAVPTPNRNHIYSMRLVIPPSIIAGKFASLIKPTFNLCLAAEKQIEGLSQLRDTLLPRLLSGSLVITDSKLVKGTKE